GCTFVGNQATAGVTAEGGAIANTLNGSTLTVTNCAFLNNQAVGINGGEAGGGAIENDGDIGGVTAHISGSLFANNRAIGGDGGVVTNKNTIVGSAYGGAIINSGDGATLTIINSTFSANQVHGGNGGNGGNSTGTYVLDPGNGGAIYQFNMAALAIDNCNFLGNQAVGGSGATRSSRRQGGSRAGDGGGGVNNQL